MSRINKDFKTIGFLPANKEKRIVFYTLVAIMVFALLYVLSYYIT